MRVRASAGMPAEDFAAHLNMRHARSLDNLSGITAGSVRSEKDRNTWEAYHRRLHETKEYDHEHSG